MTSDGFKYFRSKTTGLTGAYPASFSILEDFEEIDEADASCIECAVKPAPEPEAEPEAEVVPIPTPPVVKTPDKSKDTK